MSTPTIPPSSDIEGKKDVQLDLASMRDFEEAAIGRLLDSFDTLDFYSMSSAFSAMSRESRNMGNERGYRAYRVLMVICSFHFSVDRHDAFGPRMVLDEQRTPIPRDIAGEQSHILANIAKRIDHPLLRARVADVAWYNHRNLQDSAALAIDSYCQTIDFYLEDKLSFSYEPPYGLSSKIVDLIDRVFHIISGTGKRRALPEIVTKTWERLYASAKESKSFVALNRLANLGQIFGIIEWSIVAKDAESVAADSDNGDYPMAIKLLWELAATAHKKCNDNNSFERCKLEIVNQILEMREGVDSYLSKASWTRDAIRELRAIPGMKDRINALKLELLELQEQSVYELSSFSTPMDFSEERNGTIEIFKDLTLPEFLYRFALITSTPEKIAIHSEIINSRNDSFLSDMFNGRIYTDQQGRVINKAPYINLNETPPADWYDHESLPHLDFYYQIAVEARIKPAARTLLKKFAIDDHHLMAIVSASPFVATGYEQIYALGLARFFQGDLLSACHILFPQLENSLRTVLSDSGLDTSKLDEEMLQEDRSISGLLKNRRENLESIFGIDLVYTIDLLFNFKGGPCLRHELAHGKLSVGACYLGSSFFACWLMYHLVCLPLLPHWKTHVASDLELASL